MPLLDYPPAWDAEDAGLTPDEWRSTMPEPMPPSGPANLVDAAALVEALTGGDPEPALWPLDYLDSLLCELPLDTWAEGQEDSQAAWEHVSEARRLVQRLHLILEPLRAELWRQRRAVESCLPLAADDNEIPF